MSIPVYFACGDSLQCSELGEALAWGCENGLLALALRNGPPSRAGAVALVHPSTPQASGGSFAGGYVDQAGASWHAKR